MPYPNEHACRKVDPKEFDEFRRENNKFGDGIHAIFGIKTKPKRHTELQAIRFSKDKFTVAKAKKWLKDHDHTCILFEPASGESAYFPMSGHIGYDVSPADVRGFLLLSEGQDVEIQISSPGGFVFPGLEIYNLLRNYEGKVTTRLVGLAASMASYIAMAGDRIIAEDNAVFMIHNASGFGMGDHRVMFKVGKTLEGLSTMLAKKYVEKSKRPLDEIKKLMDEETILFGDEILEGAFVDEIIKTDKEKNKESAVAMALAACQACKMKMKEAELLDDLEKAAAFLDIEKDDPKNKGGDKEGKEKSWKFCVCSSCGYSEKHTPGKKCNECPECGEQMHGSNEKPKEEDVMKKLSEIMAIKDPKERKAALEEYLKGDLTPDQRTEVFQLLMAEPGDDGVVGELKSQIKTLQANITTMGDQMKADQKALAEEKDARRLLEIETSLKGKEVVGDIKKTAKMIHSLEKISPELSKEMETYVVDTTNMLRAAGILSELGKSGEGKGASAYEKLKAKVDELLKTAEFNGLSPAKAWKKVINENSDLYKEYLKER